MDRAVRSTDSCEIHGFPRKVWINRLRSMDRADPQITPNIYSRVRKDYTPLHVYLGCVWVVIHVKYITYEGLLHNTLALDVDTVQEAACRAYTANSRLTHEKALSLCEWFRNLVNRNVVRATPAVVELNSDWLNHFTRTRGSGLGHQDWVIAKHKK